MGATLNDINVKFFELALPSNSLGRRTRQDYTARCPICGDGKNKRSKRFHLYTKSSFDHDVVKCFNGDCEYSSNMYGFLRDYYPSLLQSYTQEMNGNKINHIQEFLQQEKSEPVIETLDIDDTFRPPYVFDIPDIFHNITDGSYADEYLQTRGIAKDDYHYFFEVQGNGIFKDDDKEKNLTDYIIIPLFYGKRLYGFTSRSTKNKDFYTRIPEDNVGWKVWNLFNVDFNKPLYIFEATFDAMSIEDKNVVACLGADFPEEFLKMAKEPIFVYDNTNIDKTGLKKAINYAIRNFKVMVWPKINFKDFNAILTRGGSREKLQKFLDNNVFQGLSALVRLKMD
jgi:hypothetical protein